MKILLFTSSPLTEKSSAWLLLNKMINNITDYEVIVYSASFLLIPKIKLDKYKVINHFLLFKTPIIVKIINKVCKKMNYHIDKLYSVSISNRLRRIITDESIDKIWIYSEKLTIITLIQLLKTKVLPYHISIFDDFLFDKTYLAYGQELQNEFISILKNSKSLDVIVPEQRDFYIEKKYISEDTPIGISYGGTFKNPIKQNYEVKKALKKICLTGNIFGLWSFIKFCSAIQDICLKNNIEFHIYLNNDKLTELIIKKSIAKFKNFVFIKSFIPEKEIIHTLLDYDLAYIQVSFEEGDKHKAVTSFPSKSHNYLYSTVPILLHSPNYAAVFKFMVKNNICYSINSIDKDQIRNEFSSVLNFKTRKLIHENIIRFNNKPNNNFHFNELKRIISTV